MSKDDARKKQRKSFRGEWKQLSDEGSFEAVIATLGVVDSDGDVVEPGAMIRNGSVPILPAHNQGSVPLGKAKIEERGDHVIAVGRFNLQVETARDWHAAIKFDLQNPPAVQEYSWGYHPAKFRFEDRDGVQVRVLEEVDMLEVSPVLRGASVGTRTIAAKRKDNPSPDGTEVEDGGDGEGDGEGEGDGDVPRQENREQGVKLVDQLASAGDVVRSALDRFKDLKDSRAKKGKRVSGAASDELIRVATSIAALSRELEEVHELLNLESTISATADSKKVTVSTADWTAHKARFGK